ncbi:nicotinamide riboside transporter PnuC [Mannheimia sp. AT1]|uniref:Nicotinamide riboside transporter PnuC n=1 Tax=Mannheimia cairinae TaxID=3025936 RepID=A0ABT5MUJ6_9PAST|nr:nicotinamide riboside transporter PnuC [Mannheimia cairinae]MDD0824543.1 nicotinamide riboside transporter PnuC [Mannheimia cairinae]MDD0825644.1 nicotinamide riboside transporter PnuC [Mannheimia cairinae]
MNFETALKQVKNELFGGWKPLEAAFLIFCIVAIIWQGMEALDEKAPVLGMIAGVSGIICNVFISKGKISNYFFGLIFAYSYFYVAWANNFLGEMNTTLYVYIPAQFIGYFLWKTNMQKEEGNDVVVAKALTLKGWVGLLAFLIIGTLLFVQVLNHFGGSSTGLDGLTTIIVVAAQALMLMRYREQWLLWIVLNIISIVLWADSPSVYTMYAAFLLNAIYGFWNWTKLQNTASH